MSNLIVLLDPLALLFLAGSLGLLFAIVWVLTHEIDLGGGEPAEGISGGRSSSEPASPALGSGAAPPAWASIPDDQRPAA